MNNLTELIRKAREEKAPHRLFKAVFKESASWEDFLDWVERSKSVNKYRENAEGLYIMNSTTLEDIINFKNIQEFHNSVLEAYEKNELPSYGMTVIVSKIYRNQNVVSGITRHTDPIDTIHWQCVGATLWHAWDDQGNMTEYIVEPGDVIFINYEHEHEVESLTPRAGILFTAGTGYADKERMYQDENGIWKHYPQSENYKNFQFECKSYD